MPKYSICFAVLCPKSTTQPEEDFHHENDLKSGNPPTYSNKLRESNVVDNAFERCTSELETNMDSFGQQDNDETYVEQCQQLEQANAENYEESNSEIEGEMHPTQVNQSTSKQTPFFTDDVINEHIRSLNDEQRKVFDVLHVLHVLHVFDYLLLVVVELKNHIL